MSAAEKLAASGGWSDTGAGGGALWGACKGSGKVPYAVAVDLSGPAYRCSCPSRKFPCKHAVALLLRWADGEVSAGTAPADVASWIGKRAERAGGAAARSASGDGGAGDGDARARGAGDTVADPEAQRKRAEERAARVAGGLDDLERWLGDQLRSGLAGLLQDTTPLSTMARRMVDAQAPGIARRLEGARRRPEWGFDGRPAGMLDELALLHLLIRSYRRVAADPGADAALTATVRQHVGFPVTEASVRERPGIADHWLVGDRRDEPDEQLVRRTTWLHGERTGRTALLLAFAPPGQPLAGDELVPGTVLEAELHFYPGAHEQRALLGAVGGPSRPATAAPAGTIDQALDIVGAALAADPWLGRTAAWVDGVLGEQGLRWTISDELGDALVVRTGLEGWELLASGGGLRRPHLLEWSPTGWRLLGVAGWAPATAPTDLETAPW